MDTITHGIAGALIGKALFRGDDILLKGNVSSQRVVTASVMFGAIFPDADTFRDLLSSNQLLMITWHRSITHSLLCLPIFALLLAALTRTVVRWRKWPAPSFAALAALYAIGILSHILLDLVTTFGTMIWSPLAWARPAWDILFIVDFSFTAILLLPQLLAWVFREHHQANGRALAMWLLFVPAPLLIAWIGQIVGAPVSARAMIAAVVLFTALFLLPALLGWGIRVSHEAWNRSGFVAALLYLVLAAYAHHLALGRVQQFVALERLEAESIGALPFPPSLWQWDGLVRTPRGVYEVRMDLTHHSVFALAAGAASASAQPVEYKYFPDAFPNSYIEQARHLAEVQKVLWFARFPVTRFHTEGNAAVVEISDLRFPQIRPNRPASFTYRVRFDSSGKVLDQGWAR